ncbi:hypothetical protein WA026_010232 [Henosepilachna vigintioctopunctata]|uniref:Anoctamin n=1 Tax=Henosepilachna vigintioctopunctata TaxID=420089 RepID=A0AAW1UGP3_9CUCU
MRKPLKNSWQTIGRRQPKFMTQAERILIAHNMLREIPFGTKKGEKGLESLQKYGVVADSFPLHEGPSKLTPHGPLTDRQLLAAFWGDVVNAPKEQPTDIIQKYFGPEMGFYFIFVDLFNKMLAIAAIVSVILFFLGCVIPWTNLKAVTKSVCLSKEYLCPVCDPSVCLLEHFKDYCSYYTKFCYDNFGTFFLGMFISIWGTIFFELWTRERNLHKVKWNLMNVELDTAMRPGYAEQTDAVEKSPITGEMEPTMSRQSLTWRYGAVTLMMIGMILFIVHFVLLTTAFQASMFKHFVKTGQTNNLQIKVDSFGAVLQAIFIVIVDKIKKPAARYMTDLQNCRTQYEYDESFILKLWIISFVNGFTAILYTALLKGVFYTNPGDTKIYNDFYSFRKDICGAGGCSEDTRILLIFIVITETILMKTTAKLVMTYLNYINIQKKFQEHKERVQWETAYLYGKMAERAVLEHVTEIIHRLTMVLFCTTILPLLPLIIFVCNFIDTRVDAFVYVNLRRRPIPRKVTGLGVWYFIMHFVVVISVLVNALTSSLTKGFLKMEFHRYYYGSLDIYIQTRFSKFAIKDFSKSVANKLKKQVKGIDHCLYNRPYRYPPDNKKLKYQSSLIRFTQFAYTAGFIIVYQHVVFIMHALISKSIPNISTDVKEYLYYQITKEKRILRKHRNQIFMATRRSENSNMRRVTITEL